MKLLLVEDDTLIGETLAETLRDRAFSTDWVKDGAAADNALRNHPYDLVILDLGLPKRSGMDVLLGLRQRQDSVPVLILTARDAIEDRVRGLNSGADDYLVKPFDLNELLARVFALVRRSAGHGDTTLRIGSVTITPASREVSVDGNPVELSAREWAVLEPLITRPGTVFSRAQLEQKVFGWHDDVGSNAIEVYVHSLRRKLGPGIIRNMRGIGYVVDKP